MGSICSGAKMYMDRKQSSVEDLTILYCVYPIPKRMWAFTNPKKKKKKLANILIMQIVFKKVGAKKTILFFISYVNYKHAYLLFENDLVYKRIRIFVHDPGYNSRNLWIRKRCDWNDKIFDLKADQKRQEEGEKGLMFWTCVWSLFIW